MKYPFIKQILKNLNCRFAKIDNDIDLDNVWYIKYYEWEHVWIRYFIISWKWKKIAEVPWKQLWSSKYISCHDDIPLTLWEAIDEKTEYILTYYDNSDPNEKELVIYKCPEKNQSIQQ